MINFGPVPIGAVLPVLFDSYAGSTGASITITGLAVTDIEIYKGVSMTQRASDAGYVLIDTDGIDIDTITGIHGFSIDTGDNTDAGFYAAGSYYTVVVSAITVDSQTVNFIAATFRCATAETVASQPKMDVAAITTGVDLTATMKTSVNTEVVDGLNVDTYAEPGQGAPGATISLAAKINYLYKFLRNRITQTATTMKVYADDATTVDHKSTVSDDATTYDRGEIAAGP